MGMLDPCSGSDNVPCKPPQSSAQARCRLGRGRFPVLHTHREGILPSRTPRLRLVPRPSLGVAARGGPRSTRCVPRPAHARTCSGCWPTASSPDLSDAEHTVGMRPSASVRPEKQAFYASCERRPPPSWSSHAGGGVGEECYLVDPASSHMLVSKIKPCMFKKLVVGLWVGPAAGVHRSSRPFCRRCAPGLNWPGRASGAVTLKKLECSKQAYALYTLAWDNIIGFRNGPYYEYGLPVIGESNKKSGTV
ncbi:UNVERIFIED_CONTAM: hypothetical protein Sradi_7113000 [Sesamum radiatum]|uniref:Uncharacterized protein n=1 Tax=Sesamum radiatum TaxID=300843 RepID=A0AAW2IZZ8_SESRA